MSNAYETLALAVLLGDEVEWEHRDDGTRAWRKVISVDVDYSTGQVQLVAKGDNGEDLRCFMPIRANIMVVPAMPEKVFE